jgi:RNA polymerase sigma factor (sigma-70 family)
LLSGSYDHLDQFIPGSLRIVFANASIDNYFDPAFLQKYRDQDPGMPFGFSYFQFVDNNAITNEYAENNELRIKLNRAFKTLNPRHKEIALLFFVKDRSYNEIANVLNMSLGTVKPSIFRIRKLLQKKLMNEKKEYLICNNNK